MHCVDLGESFHMSIYLQILASIQPRTSLSKFVQFSHIYPAQRFNLHIGTTPAGAGAASADGPSAAGADGAVVCGAACGGPVSDHELIRLARRPGLKVCC